MSDATTQSDAVRKGLEGVVAGETAISDVDGQRCQLIYRGYSIDELVGKVSYEEVSALLLFGALPTRSQLADWTRQLVAARRVEPPLRSLLQALPRRANPMALLRTAISALGLYDEEADGEPGELAPGNGASPTAGRKGPERDEPEADHRQGGGQQQPVNVLKEPAVNLEHQPEAPAIATFSRKIPRRICRAIGAAAWPPLPPRSTSTATTTTGS